MNPQPNVGDPAPTPADTPRVPRTPLRLVRWAVLAVAVAFVLVGLLFGEQLDVYWKAATVCLECIGIG